LSLDDLVVCRGRLLVCHHVLHLVHPGHQTTKGLAVLAGLEETLVELALSLCQRLLQTVPQVVHCLQVLLHDRGVHTTGSRLDQSLSTLVGLVHLLAHGGDHLDLELLELLLLLLDSLSITSDSTKVLLLTNDLLDIVHDAGVVIVERLDLCNHGIYVLVASVPTSLQLLNRLLETSTSILKLPWVGNNTRADEVLDRVLDGSNLAVLLLNPLQEGLNLVLLLVQGVEVSGNGTHLVQLIVKHGEGIAKILGPLVELSDSGAGILQVLSLVFKPVPEVAQPVAETVDSISNWLAISANVVSIVEKILSSLLDFTEALFQVLCFIEEPLDLIQKPWVLGCIICGTQLIFRPLQAVLEISCIIVEVTQLGQDVSDSLRSLRYEVVEVVPPLFHDCQLLLDDLLIHIAGSLEGVAATVVGVIFRGVLVHIVSE